MSNSKDTDAPSSEEAHQVAVTQAQKTAVAKTNAKLQALLNDPEDEFNQYVSQMPVEVRNRVNRQQSRLTTGLKAGAILLCPGYIKCKFKEHCTIPKRLGGGKVDPGRPDHYPIGLECVVERQYYESQYIGYCNELFIDLDSVTERGTAQELATIDILKRRAQIILSTGDHEGFGTDFMLTDKSYSDKAFDVDNDGSPLLIGTTTKVHPVVAVLDQLERRRMKHLEALMATRKERAAYMAKVAEHKQAGSDTQRLVEIVSKTLNKFKTNDVIDVSIASEYEDDLKI